MNEQRDFSDESQLRVFIEELDDIREEKILCDSKYCCSKRKCCPFLVFLMIIVEIGTLVFDFLLVGYLFFLIFYLSDVYETDFYKTFAIRAVISFVPFYILCLLKFYYMLLWLRRGSNRNQYIKYYRLAITENVASLLTIVMLIEANIDRLFVEQDPNWEYNPLQKNWFHVLAATLQMIVV